MNSSPSKLFTNDFKEHKLEYLGSVSLDGLKEFILPAPEVYLCKPSNAAFNFYKITINGHYLGIVDEIDMYNLKERMTKDGTITSTLYRQSGNDFWFEGFLILDRYNTEIFRAIQVRTS